MQMSDQFPTWKLLFHVVEAFRNLRDRSTPHQRRHRITLSQLKVLGCILFHPEEKVMVKEIASELGITSGGVSQILDRLVRGGMVERKVNEQDRRAVEVTLSERGKLARMRHDEEFASLEEQLMRGISPSRQKTFRLVLGKMIDNLQVVDKNKKKSSGRKGARNRN